MNAHFSIKFRIPFVNVGSISTFVQIKSGAASEPHPLVLAANLKCGSPLSSQEVPLTKAVVTVGPSCDDAETLRRLIQAGATGFRFNMSHVCDEATLQKTLQTVLRIRLLAAQEKREVAIFADMKGAEFRVRSDGSIPLAVGDIVRITTRPGKSSKSGSMVTIHIEGPERYQLVRDLKRHNEPKFMEAARPIVLIDDANVGIELHHWSELFVADDPDAICGTVRFGSMLHPNKGLNFPGLDLPHLPGMTTADHWILEKIFDVNFVAASWGVFQDSDSEIAQMVADASANGIFHLLGFDYVAPSFVRTFEDLERFKHLLQSVAAYHIGLIPKIETGEAVDPDVLSSLMSHPWTRGVMVARGDLAAQVGLERVPFFQREVLRRAREAGRFSIVATDVLGSMTAGNPRATRSEHDGLFGIVEFGGDSFMLSNETAAGKRPAEVVAYALHTLLDRYMEGVLSQLDVRNSQRVTLLDKAERHYAAMLEDRTISLEMKLQAKLYLDLMRVTLGADHDPLIDGLVVWSHRGESVRFMAQALPGLPVYVVTDNRRVAREASLMRSMYPILVKEKPRDGKELLNVVMSTIQPPPGKTDYLLQVMHNLDV